MILFSANNALSRYHFAFSPLLSPYFRCCPGFFLKSGYVLSHYWSLPPVSPESSSCHFYLQNFTLWSRHFQHPARPATTCPTKWHHPTKREPLTTPYSCWHWPPSHLPTTFHQGGYRLYRRHSTGFQSVLRCLYFSLFNNKPLLKCNLLSSLCHPVG